MSHLGTMLSKNIIQILFTIHSSKQYFASKLVVYYIIESVYQSQSTVAVYLCHTRHGYFFLKIVYIRAEIILFSTPYLEVLAF